MVHLKPQLRQLHSPSGELSVTGTIAFTEYPSQGFVIRVQVKLVPVEVASELARCPYDSPALNLRRAILLVNPVAFRSDEQLARVRDDTLAAVHSLY
ncbi:hypothetical protein ON010_g15245 [Phytophthora cinnamomi]|nr:hypothetical protein ON010_g15245 [Phytophthora cinnamomi]